MIGGIRMKKLLGLSCLLLFVTVLFVGCSDVAITDEDTNQEVQTITVREDLETVTHLADNMDRGNHDYATDYHSELVVDLNVDDYKRGDVVYYTVPEKDERSISRIVALPGEEIEIKDGQVYIDEKELNTFYGREYHTGQLVKDSDTNMKKIKVPEGHYFVMGDNWWRSHDSKHFGPLVQENIKGKVLGYKK